MSSQTQDVLQNLNRAQRAAATAGGNALVWAGPGSGKTQLAAGRAGWLVETDRCLPHELLVVTFTNRAVAQFRQRLEAMLGTTAAGGIRVSTFHSLALSLVEMEGQLGTLAGGKRPRLIGGQARLSLLDELIAQTLKAQPGLGSGSHTTSLSGADARQRTAKIGQLISHFKAGGGGSHLSETENELPEDQSSYSETPGSETLGEESDNQLTRRLAREIYSRYRQHLTDRGLLDLDDLIPRAIQSLKKYPKLARLPGVGVRQVLLDETQDTAPQQLELLLELMRVSATEQPTGSKNSPTTPQLLAVGDERQQIYSYLHGGKGPYARLTQALDRPAQLHLDLQYRYGPTINRAANLISWHLGREEVTHPTRQTDDPQGQFYAFIDDGPKRGGQLPITVYEALDEGEEGAFVAAEIIRIQSRLPQASIAVLVRTHRQARHLGQQLGTKGLKYHYLNSQGEPPEVTTTQGEVESEGGEQLSVNPIKRATTWDAESKNLAFTPVTVLTIHGAKGSEFDVVFVTGLAQGLFPVGRGQLLEDLRLFFVALTRARYLLFLSYPLHIERGSQGTFDQKHGYHTDFKKSQAVAPSSFLSILP